MPSTSTGNPTGTVSTPSVSGTDAQRAGCTVLAKPGRSTSANRGQLQAGSSPRVEQPAPSPDRSHVVRPKANADDYGVTSGSSTSPRKSHPPVAPAAGGPSRPGAWFGDAADGRRSPAGRPTETRWRSSTTRPAGAVAAAFCWWRRPTPACGATPRRRDGMGPVRRTPGLGARRSPYRLDEPTKRRPTDRCQRPTVGGDSSPWSPAPALGGPPRTVRRSLFGNSSVTADSLPFRRFEVRTGGVNSRPGGIGRREAAGRDPALEPETTRPSATAAPRLRCPSFTTEGAQDGSKVIQVLDSGSPLPARS